MPPAPPLGVFLAASLLLLGCASAPTLHVKTQPFVPPDGRYAIGTTEMEWTDQSRDEPYTRDPGDRRRVIVQIWYPAVAGSGPRAHYLARPADYSDWFEGRRAARVRVNAMTDAKLAPSASPWRVLIYNHGVGGTRFSAIFTTEWLASHGYVVVSIEHLGASGTTRYLDGKRFVADSLLPPNPTGHFIDDSAAAVQYYGGPGLELWKADTMNAMPGPFEHEIDLSRIGAFGWSFGGALAVELSRTDPLIVAAVDHDGRLYGEVVVAGTHRPVMRFWDSFDYLGHVGRADHEEAEQVYGTWMAQESHARDASTADWYAVMLEPSEHSDYSDLPIFVGTPEKRRSAQHIHELLNAYTLAFFDRYVRDEDPPLLRSGAQRLPGATLEVRIRQSPANASD